MTARARRVGGWRALMGGVLLLGAASLAPSPWHRTAALPTILCSTAVPDAPARPRSSVSTLRSEPLAGSPGKWVTVQLVRYPPGALTPAHVHGGDVTVYVLEGLVRSEHAGLPPADFPTGQTFHEPFGTTHVFIENPSATAEAAILAVIVHDEGAALTTFLD